MKKTQDLPYYWGDSDRWKWGTTSGFNTSSPVWLDFDAIHAYNVGKAAANVQLSPVPFIGTQSFESGTRRPPLYNNLTNVKLVGVNVPYLTVFEDYRRPTSLSCHQYMRLNPYSTCPISVPNPVDWSCCDAAQRRAWWEMQPRFEGEVQALNFLFELKDFRSIVKHAARFNYGKMYDSLKNARSTVLKSLKKAKASIASAIRSPLRSTVKAVDFTTITIAEARLTKEFAIDPTVKDCMAIHSQLATLVEQVQNKFFERGKSVQSRHYSEKISEDTSQLTTGLRNAYMWDVGTYLATKFTATMQYRYDYATRNLVDALKRYYGFELNAEVVWNALPFSFVVDYFYKVGNALHSMRTDPNVDVMLTQYCESLVSTISYGVHYNGDPRVLELVCPSLAYKGTLKSLAVGAFSCFSGFSGTHYRRKVTHPNKGTALPRVTLPSSGQVKNMLALARVFW